MPLYGLPISKNKPKNLPKGNTMSNTNRTYETATGVTITAAQEFGAFSGSVTLSEKGHTVLKFEHHNAVGAADELRVMLDRAYAQGAQNAAKDAL